MSKKYESAKKVIAIVMTLAVLFVISYFATYEGIHTIHDCTGESCPICHTLHIAETFTKQISSLTFFVSGCFLMTVFYMFIRTVIFYSISERNLIVDKVRMDN